MFSRKKQGAIDVVCGNEPLVGDSLQSATDVLEKCLGEGLPRAVFDMHEIALINSEGLEMLVDMKEVFEQRAGMLKLAGLNPLCRDILAATGLDEQFEVFPEVKRAVGSFLQ